MSTFTIESIGIIFSIILGAIALVVSISQLRNSTKQMQSATSASMYGYLMKLNEILLANTEAEMRLLGGDHFNAESIEIRKAQIMADIYLTFVEEVYYQYQRFDAYTDAHWNTWYKFLHIIGESPFVRNYWATCKDNYDPDFIKVVDLAFTKLQEEDQTPQQNNQKQ